MTSIRDILHVLVCLSVTKMDICFGIKQYQNIPKLYVNINKLYYYNCCMPNFN
jgi:hypothetical protein